jgi:anti-sigma28 factor (negative regulator of flagellin synthesis)
LIRKIYFNGEKRVRSKQVPRSVSEQIQDLNKVRKIKLAINSGSEKEVLKLL